MANVKRTLSALLAVVMVFTMMTVAFTVVGSAAPTVPRVASTKLSPTVEMTVPQVIETYGTDYYQGGSNVKASGQVQVTVTDPNGAVVSDVALACSDAGVQLSPRAQSGNGSVWTVQGGTLKTAPSDDGTTVIKWTVTCTVGGKSYVTYAWSQVKPHRNNPGYAVKVRHKNTLSKNTTYNHHIEWIMPVLGNAANEPPTRTLNSSHSGDSSTDELLRQCFHNETGGQHTLATGLYASSYNWDWHVGDADDITRTAPAVAKGTMYVDVSQLYDLSDVGMASRATPHHELDTPSDHPQFYRGTEIISQSVNGGASSNFSVTSTGKTEISVGSVIGDDFSGSLPAAGGTAQINAQVHWEGNVNRLWGFATQESYNRSNCDYQINIVTYNKTALWTAINKATKANYQASQFRNTAPSGSSSAFRTWDQYLAALQNAWYIYGREDVNQTQINSALSTLNAALPNYSVDSGNWVSGMMYGDADYSQINVIINTIPETLDPDFFEDYSDGTHGKYYQYSLASLLNDALDDIAYDKPLDARYQGTVDQMRLNLSNAINSLVETAQYQTTKSVSVEFIANATDVSGMPSAITTRLTGQFTKPTNNPSKSFYKFTGWYYDEAATQLVSWPLNINPNDGHFKANLNVKNDNAGVAYTLYAGWQLTGKMLTFDTQGGSEMAPAVGENGTAYGGPTETPTKTGYRFVGWYADAALQSPVDWSTFTFGTLSVVYAKWERDTFIVNFYANGGTFANGSSNYSEQGLFGDPVSEPTPPSRSNAAFVGWYYDAALQNAVDFSTFTFPGSNMQLYAKWNENLRNVTFDAQNGTTPAIYTYEKTASVYAPAQPTRAGYTFKGWFTVPAATGTPVTFPYTLSGNNMTFYGGWNPQPFTVTFDPGSGASMAPGFNAADYRNLPCGSVLVAPEDPIKEGYVFTGWTLNGEPYTLSTVPAQNITLVASWEVEPNTAKFRLRTDLNGTLSQGDIITATVSMQANHYVAGHSFIVYYDKQYLAPYFNGKAVTNMISGTSACSTIANRAYFTMVQDSAGGCVTGSGTATGRISPGNIAPTTQYYPEEWIVDTRTLKEEYSNYEFVYFNVSDMSSGTRVQPNGEVDVATFQFIVLDNAPLADGTTSYAQILMPSEFTRTPDRTAGKVAACLQADAAYTNVKDWDSTVNVVLDGDHRFAVTQMQTCHINFITNGGSTVEAIENAKQGRAIQLPTPTRDYYDFAGWTLTNDASDTAYVNASAYVVPSQPSITLYAKWTGKQVYYYVRHHKQNVEANAFLENFEQQSFRAAVGTSVTATPKTYPGFTCTNPGESGIVRGESANPLYLDLWYLRNVTHITVDADGGKFSNSQQTVTLTGLFDATVTNVPENPTKDGYTFAGWQYQNATYTFSKYPSEDITVTAKWTPKTITVRFFLNGSTSPYATLTGQFGTAITAPTVTVNDGELFSGWRNSGGTLFSYTTFPAENEDFYGSVGIDGHMLTLFINGVQYGDPLPVPNGTTVTETYIGYSPNPGYKFTGWRTANSRDGALAQFPMTLSAETTLYGFTERETYSIRTYIYVDGEMEEGPSVDNLFYGVAFDLPEPDDYTDSGYGFRGWYTDPELTIPYEKPATMPAENIVLYGEYYELTGTIEFDLNGGTGTAPASITKTVGTTVTLPAGTGFSKKFYTFGGWSTSPTGSTAITRYTIIGEGTIKMYAIWKVNYATVSFNLNGAESGTRPANMQAEVGTPIPAAELPSGADFVKTGYIFVGWATKASATTALEAYTAPSTGSKTLYAVWIADTVTLVVREGSTGVVDNTRGFIYGLDFELTANDVKNNYLAVVGNGHLEFDSDTVGTGTVVNVVNDYTGNIDATYTIVIFGDLNGDGMMNSSDVTALRNINARMVVPEEGSALEFAADVTHDGMVNTSDITLIRSVNARLTTIDQTI